MQLKSELGSIELTTKGTDMLIITFKDESGTQFAQIKLRGKESDAVMQRIKAIGRVGRR